MQEVDAGDDGGSRVLLATLWWPIPEVQGHPGHSRYQANHKTPERPLEKSRDKWILIFLGIEFYLFVSHGGMKRQRVHV